MSEPIRDAETAVRELGALPVPVGTSTALTAEQRAAIAELIGDAKPATARLVEQLAKSVRDRREHEHPTWEDLYCLNLVSWMGERMGPVLRRLLDAETRLAELETLTAQATEFRLWEPGYGLYVRRAPGALGFAVMEARRSDKGRRVWTTSGWQYSALLSATELFCWPDAGTAVAEARRVMPGAVVREEPEAQRTLHDHIVARDAEIERLKARLAEYERPADEDPIRYALTEQAPVTIFRAEHPDSGITLGHYGTPAAARAHCEATERRSWPTGTTLSFDWIRDALPEDEENGVAELVVTAGQNEESTTGYIVTALEVPSEYDEEADE